MFIFIYLSFSSFLFIRLLIEIPPFSLFSFRNSNLMHEPTHSTATSKENDSASIVTKEKMSSGGGGGGGGGGGAPPAAAAVVAPASESKTQQDDTAEPMQIETTTATKTAENQTTETTKEEEGEGETKRNKKDKDDDVEMPNAQDEPSAESPRGNEKQQQQQQQQNGESANGEKDNEMAVVAKEGTTAAAAATTTTTESPAANKADASEHDAPTTTDAVAGNGSQKATTSASENKKDEKEVTGENAADNVAAVAAAAAEANSTADEKKEDHADHVEEKPAAADTSTKATPIKSNTTESTNAAGAAATAAGGGDASTKKSSESTSNSSNKPADTATSAPPPPIMKGTLSCDLDDHRRHLIRGMWNYENSNVFPPQRFELARDLKPDEDEKVLPKDGEFHGNFSLAYFHTTSKGKQKARSKVIQETGVKIKFTKIEDKEGEYKVNGKGTNQFGIFHINGTATKSKIEGDNSYHVVLRKRYEPSEQQQTAAPASGGATTASAGTSLSRPSSVNTTGEGDSTGPLPEPSKSFPSGVVCLRGKLFKEQSHELGLDEHIHRINGMWSSGLDYILGDPQNVRGLCNRFEYEHKSSQPNSNFPVSGRYSGWFDLSGEDGKRTRINERDVTLRFRKNKAGYYNVEGKGSNVFGKYTISGTLTADNVITIFRHFQPRKIKASKSGTAGQSATTAAGSGGAAAGGSAGGAAAAGGSSLSRRPSAALLVEPKLKIDDVKLPDEGSGSVNPITPPANGTYSAVSRGVLRVHEDGAHTCQGKWAVTREHFTNGQTSSFNFRLEPHYVQEAIAEAKKKGGENASQFPLDSAMYKGSFQLKKQGSRYQTIVDQQVVMKFRRNSQGSFNVHGKGINAIGEFNLVGTLVMSGKTGGQVELYRMYPPDKLAVPPAPPKSSTETTTSKTAAAPATAAPAAPPTKLPGPPERGLVRRESTRTVKLPSRLEDDDPSAQLSRVMDKCNQILRIIREKDVELNAFFSEPVDPVALGIPTYHQIIKEPMDLRTIDRRMKAQHIQTPEEFARLMRLVFQNAMTFNIDPTHSVHQAARTLLVLFNQKFRDVERMIQNIRLAQGSDLEEKGKKKSKEDKKRKRHSEEPKSLKRRRLEEAQAMAAANASSVAAIAAAAPSTHTPNVTRSEFSMMLTMIQQLQNQVVQTYNALAELSPDVVESRPIPSTISSAAEGTASVTSAPPPERKKAAKRKSEVLSEPPVPVVDDSLPLSLQDQELLTETINELPPEHLGGVIQIIREAAPVGADEEEIDLEIDQLDAKTQRKLFRHVSKFLKKKPKAKKKTTKTGTKKTKTTKTAPKPKPQQSPPQQQKTSTTAKDSSFFAFNKNDSDSDDSDDDDANYVANPTGGKAPRQVAPAAGEDKRFQLTTDVHDEDEDEDLGGDLAKSWNIPRSTETKDDNKAEDDDAWGRAREQAEITKIREAERKAREEKMKAEAEQAQNERLKAEAAQVEKLKEQRAIEKERNAALCEQQEKEEEEKRLAAREAARAQVQSVEQTVDLEAQRDIMKQYEQSYLDKDYGSASPSSDFGF